MSGAATVPRNILYFEALLYLSLIIDCLSMLVRDDTVADPTQLSAAVAKSLTVVLILLFGYFTWLAARHRKNWARIALLVSLALSIVSTSTSVNESGVQLETLFDVISSALTALGMYYSFTGNAVGWFSRGAL